MGRGLRSRASLCVNSLKFTQNSLGVKWVKVAGRAGHIAEITQISLDVKWVKVVRQDGQDRGVCLSAKGRKQENPRDHVNPVG